MAVAITLKWQRALRATTFHQRAIKQPASHRIAPLTTRHHHKNLPHSPLARTPWNSLFGEKEGGRVSIMGFRGRAGGESGQIPPPLSQAMAWSLNAFGPFSFRKHSIYSAPLVMFHISAPYGVSRFPNIHAKSCEICLTNWLRPA